MEKSNEKKRIPDNPEAGSKKKGDKVSDSRSHGTGSRGAEMTNARGHHQYTSTNTESKKGEKL